MQETSEIKALIHLLDDPDDQVYTTVKHKLQEYGRAVIPNLQQAWDYADDDSMQERVELLIHDVNYDAICEELAEWALGKRQSLLDVLIILCRYKYHDLNEDNIRKAVKDMRQSVWLELNQYLTPLEQANVLTSIIFNYYNFTYEEPTLERNDCCYINNVIHNKVGSSHVLGMFVLEIAHSLDLPFYAVSVPNVLLLAYVQPSFDLFSMDATSEQKILFYLDPSNGSIYSQNDVEAYLKKHEFGIDEAYFAQIDTKKLVKQYLKQLIQISANGEIINNKEKELLQLIEIVKSAK